MPRSGRQLVTYLILLAMAMQVVVPLVHRHDHAHANTTAPAPSCCSLHHPEPPVDDDQPGPEMAQDTACCSICDQLCQMRRTLEGAGLDSEPAGAPPVAVTAIDLPTDRSESATLVSARARAPPTGA